MLAVLVLLLIANVVLSERDRKARKKAQPCNHAADFTALRAFIAGLHDGTRSRIDAVNEDVGEVAQQVSWIAGRMSG